MCACVSVVSVPECICECGDCMYVNLSMCVRECICVEGVYMTILGVCVCVCEKDIGVE